MSTVYLDGLLGHQGPYTTHSPIEKYVSLCMTEGAYSIAQSKGISSIADLGNASVTASFSLHAANATYTVLMGAWGDRITQAEFVRKLGFMNTNTGNCILVSHDNDVAGEQKCYRLSAQFTTWVT